jgi:hypothetical protein
VFSVAQRDQVRDRVVQLAAEDERVAAAAIVGSFAEGRADRWSDLDLTFGVVPGTTASVLADWTAIMAAEFGAIRLFDLPSGPSIYRVLLLPDGLQVDLSFTPIEAFGPRGGAFELIFGSIGEPGSAPQPAFPATDAERFGLAVHHLLRALICVERNRPWQAAYWIGEARDEIVVLACARIGLPTSYGRGVDLLPADTRGRLERTLVAATSRDDVLRALGATIDALALDAGHAHDDAERLTAELRSLARPDAAGPSVPG